MYEGQSLRNKAESGEIIRFFTEVKQVEARSGETLVPKAGICNRGN